MKKSRLLAIWAFVFVAAGCNNDLLQPTGVSSSGLKPVDVISDGAHGGNHDFFFLPPLLPLPINNPDFEIGKFDNSLVPVLTVEICELVVATGSLPAVDSPCRTIDATHPLTKKFNAGTVQVVNLPLTQSGWWSSLGLPPDGFYYVLWDTRQSNLSLTKYYRIKVLVNGSTDPIGYADVDPMGSIREWKYSLTGQVIQMVDDVLLPIPFRIEKGAFCATGAILCKSVVVPKTNPDPLATGTIVQLQGASGSIAGAEFPNGWLPAGYDNVVVTVSRIPGGTPNPDGSRSIACHQGLPLIQFDGCFRFTTNPELPIVGGKAFAKDVRIAVCYVLHDTNNLLRDYAEIYSSGPREETHALVGAPDASILTNHDCVNADPPIVTMRESNLVTRLASVGWRKLKEAFSVPTAHAVDLGLGGLTSAFSNEGAAITADLRAVTSTQIAGTTGQQVLVQVRTVGATVHDGTPLGEVTFGGHTKGLPRIPVTFALINAADAAIATTGDVPGPPSSQLTVLSSDFLDNSLSGGFASVLLTLPTTPGTYTMTASAPAFHSPLTFTATVTAPLADLFFSSEAIQVDPTVIPSSGGVIGFGPWTVTNQGGAASAPTYVGYFLSNDPVITTSDRGLGGTALPALGVGASFNFDNLGFTTPALSPGTYYFGVLADNANQVVESNEQNNYLSAPVTVLQSIIFESYLDGTPACAGASVCDVTDQFSGGGVIFSFAANGLEGPSPASLCLDQHSAVGGPLNYWVAPTQPAGLIGTDAECKGGYSGILTMTFPSHPRTVWFELIGSDLGAGAFPAAAQDVAGNSLSFAVLTRTPFTGRDGNFWRELRRIDSPNGIAKVDLDMQTNARFVDNVLVVR